jgi:GNAT superfamily N-acetyltransferase
MSETIRRALPADADALNAVAWASKAHWGYPAEWLQEWRDKLRVSPEHVAVNVVACAEDEAGRVVGFYALEWNGDDLMLESLFLVPAHIGRGLGRRLFEHAAQAARALGASELRLASDPNAEGFYLRLGAERVGEVVLSVLGTERVLPLMRYGLAGE